MTVHDDSAINFVLTFDIIIISTGKVNAKMQSEKVQSKCRNF